ncbi:hypothetical protein [Humibacter ginsengisoli]
MTRALTVVLSGVVGVALGAVSGRILFGGTAWNLIPWAIVAIAIGVVAGNLRTALLASAIYGYLLVAAFLYAANTGDTPFAGRILFALTLALVGPVFSIGLTVIARLVYLRIGRRRPSKR